jgi:hypothetical protein
MIIRVRGIDSRSVLFYRLTMDLANTQLQLCVLMTLMTWRNRKACSMERSPMGG